MKVCVVVTARASYARIKTALEAIDAREDLSLEVVAAGSAVLERYGNVADVMERDGFPPIRVHSVVEGGTPECMVKGTAALMSDLGTLFARDRPAAVVTIADRHETLATAVAASYQNIPLVHVQGGEVTGSIDDRVRKAVTQLADVHLVATSNADHVVEWLSPRTVRAVTGCPSVDIAARARPLMELTAGAGAEIDLSRPFVLVLQHPVTTEYSDASDQVWETIHAVQTSGLPAVWMWPNVDAGTDAVSKALRLWREESEPRVRFIRNLEPEAFCGLAKRAGCIVGNSSFGIREASFLGLPAVNVGSRQAGRERAENVVDVEHDATAIRRAILEQGRTRYQSSALYGDGFAGERIASRLAEYLGQRRAA